MDRKQTFERIESQPNVSVLVVGGGVNGISAYRELALQGVDVLLVERADFCSGASAASSHMVHGGLRYLENAEFRLVQEALTERNRLLQNAPHYVRPLPTTIPIFKWFSGLLNGPLKFLGLSSKPRERGALIIKAGLTMYDIFASTQRSMPTHSFMGRSESLRRFPGLNNDISVTATYYDAWMPYPERICLELLLDAEKANKNAHSLNYTSVVHGEGNSVTLKDELTDAEYTVQPNIVINAAGPWIDFANQEMHQETNFIGGTKGSHLVLDHEQLHQTLDGNEIFFENDDGRIVLIFPLEDRVLAGTTDIRIDHPDAAVCTEDEIEYILSLVTKVFPTLNISRDDVVFTYSGVRPLPAQDAASTGQISRDHSIRTTEAGQGTDYPIYSLIGGKWTTFRAFGEQVADRVLDKLDVPRRVKTESMPIGGGKDFPREAKEQARWASNLAHQTGIDEEQAHTLLIRYGTYAREVAKYIAQGDDRPLTNKADYSVREVQFITDNEKVQSLQDFVLRRSLLAMLGKLDQPLLEELADIIGDVRGWSDNHRADQLKMTKARLLKKNLVDVDESGAHLISDAPSEEEAEPIADMEMVPDTEPAPTPI